MTECERIIKEGLLSREFFNQETRCNFLVTSKRKKIWAIELDLYHKFSLVCEKYGLRHWGDGGTLLGAIRHNGFIPWDDDMDIIMPREDFNKLLEIGPEAFHDPYFLQIPHYDNNYGYSFAKLRNSNTTCIPDIFIDSGFNHGIHIDIFPLDEINLETFEEDKKQITNLIMRNSSYMKRNAISRLNPHQLENFNKYPPCNPIDGFERIQAIASNPLYKDSPYVANCTVTSLASKSQIWEKKWFSSTIFVKFENFYIPAPAMISERLSAQYGDFYKLPPLEMRGTWHSGVIWDPDKCYTIYTTCGETSQNDII